MIKIPAIELIPIDELKSDGQNPNRMTKQQHKRLKTSMQKYGFIVPIITNKDLVFADGEQRWIIAKELGMTQVPVIRLPVEDVDRRLLRQVLNKLRGEHDLIADAQEFEKIIAAGSEDDLKYLLDLSDNQLERYLNEIRELKDESYEIPEIEKIVTNIKRGDIYKLGRHYLMCGDATNREDVDILMNGKRPYCVFTDPPYGVGFGKHHMKESLFNKKQNRIKSGFRNWGKIEGDQSLETYLKAIDIIAAIASTKSIYLCAPSRHLHVIHAHLSKLGIYCATPIVWIKEHWVMSWERYHAQHEHIIFCGDGAHPTGKKSIWHGKTNETTVWQINRDNMNKDAKHPTQKPVELVTRAILNSSRPNDIVADFFGGSGTTLIACEQNNRVCYIMEIDPRYCQVTINRWEKYTGQKANKSEQSQNEGGLQ